MPARPATSTTTGGPSYARTQPNLALLDGPPPIPGRGERALHAATLARRPYAGNPEVGMAVELTITLVVDDTITGLWCHQCNLPSAILVRYHGESSGRCIGLTGEIHRCDDDETHVLIEREP